MKLINQEDPASAVQEEIKAVEAGPASSPENNGRFATGPSDFDPTGLRGPVTWEKLEESLDSHMPDHLRTPTLVEKEEEIIKLHEERDSLIWYYLGKPHHRCVLQYKASLLESIRNTFNSDEWLVTCEWEQTN